MTVNIAINLGSVSLLIADRLRITREKGADLTNGQFEVDDCLADKLGRTTFGMTCSAGAVGGASIKLLNDIDPSTVSVELVLKKLAAYADSLRSHTPHQLLLLERSSCLIALTQGNLKPTKIFSIKPPFFENRGEWSSRELKVGDIEWAFPLGFSEDLKTEYRTTVSEIVHSFIEEQSWNDEIPTKDLEELMVTVSILLGSMQHHSQFVNDKLLVGLVFSDGRRLETSFDCSNPEPFEYHPYPTVKPLRKPAGLEFDI